MSSGTPYIGTKISLISKAEIRYEGILYAIDTKNATVTLANVRSFGTEDRKAEKNIPPRDEVYEYIVFRGQDIKDLLVCETPSKQLPQDPAIVQSGNVGLPSGGYSHFHTPVTYPQAPSYGPFSGLPSYGGYPPGIQQPFADRQIPGHVHPGMVPPGPLLPPRIPTPPPSHTMPLSRSHTPSPETVLPIAPSSIHGEAKSDEISVKTTSQQGTQTVPTKRRSSRSSSRRNSEDKTEPVQERKRQEQRRQETKGADATVKDADSSKQSGQTQKPRQGSNRRSQGRRGNANARGSKGRTGAVKFDGEFDFESSNAKFRKEEIEEELQQKMTENLRITYEGENAMNSTADHDVLNDRPQSPASFYDCSKSFFDSISCEANDRDRNRRAHPSWLQERKVNMETFGMSGGMRRGGWGRGRGRGGYRGGRGGSRPQGRDGSRPQGRDGSSRGGWRGGRGSRGNRSKPWVDDAVNGDDRLPTSIPNGPSAPGAVGGTIAKA